MSTVFGSASRPDPIQEREYATMNSPFDLANDTGYRAWRDAKLAAYPRSVDELVVPLADPRHLTRRRNPMRSERAARAPTWRSTARRI